jgi:glutaminase-like protein
VRPLSKGPPPLPPVRYPAWLGNPLGQRPLPRWGVTGQGPAGTEANPLTMIQAQALMDEFRATDIPFDWPEEFCYARAHQMRRMMVERGVHCWKLWNYPRDPSHKLRVPDTGRGPITWSSHVAPAVMVLGPRGPQPMVLDPSLFRQPVSPGTWTARQGDLQSRVEPSLGQVYLRSWDGSWEMTDDAYKQTDSDLDQARAHRDAWDAALDPETGRPRPGDGGGSEEE